VKENALPLLAIASSFVAATSSILLHLCSHPLLCHPLTLIAAVLSSLFSAKELPTLMRELL